MPNSVIFRPHPHPWMKIAVAVDPKNRHVVVQFTVRHGMNFFDLKNL